MQLTPGYHETGTRRIMGLDELFSLVRRSDCEFRRKNLFDYDTPSRRTTTLRPSSFQMCYAYSFSERSPNTQPINSQEVLEITKSIALSIYCFYF